MTKAGSPLYAYTATWQGQQLASSTDSVNGTGTYGYDDFQRLKTAAIGSSAGTLNLTWGYDRYGNRVSQSAAGSYISTVGQPSLSISPTTNEITSAGYTYDGAGNLRTDGTDTYTYDAEGNLTAISGTTAASFTYDAMNQRVLTTINGTTRAYGFNAAGQRATVWDGNANLLSAQYYVNGQPLAYWLASDGHVRFQHQDWVGTERFRTTSTGILEGAFTSLPFGDSRAATGNDTDIYHFAGLDADTPDLQHATFREYSSTGGRWLHPDPYDGSYDATNPQSFNRYTYVLNNPIGYVDPSGLDDPAPPCNGFDNLGRPCDPAPIDTGGSGDGTGGDSGSGDPGSGDPGGPPAGSLPGNGIPGYGAPVGNGNGPSGSAPSNGLTPIGPNPCSTADPTKLNYNVVNNYRGGPDTALNHISQGHISFFTGKSTYYGFGPGNLGATGNMMRLNALTLNQGLLMRISSNGALTLTYYSPLVEMPMGPFTIVQGYVGTDQSGTQTQFNTLIVKGCTDPQTSHPGIP